VFGRTVHHTAEHNIVSYMGPHWGEGYRFRSLELSKLTSSAECMSMYELWSFSSHRVVRGDAQMGTPGPFVTIGGKALMTSIQEGLSSTVFIWWVVNK
jgi:hypothetical protein